MFPCKVDLILDEDIEIIPETPPKIDDEEIFGSKLKLKNEYDIKTYDWRGNNDEIDFIVKWAYRVEDNHATFMLNQESSLLGALHSRFHRNRFGVCGFSVPLQLTNLCFDLNRLGFCVANKTTPKDFKFSIDRQQLLESEAYKNCSSEVSKLVHEAYRNFLKCTDSYDPKNIYNLNMQSTLHGGNVYDQYTGDELEIAYQYHPDLLCFKLIKVEPNRSFTEASSVYVNLTDLLQRKGILWVNQNSYKTTNIGYSSHMYFKGENLIKSVYEYVRSNLESNSQTTNYVIEANRPASMLFDNDPDSTVEFIDSQMPFYFCFQKLSIENIQLATARNYIYDNIRGIWAGAVYIKEFDSPNNIPFVFLGRYRVLIQKDSQLHKTISDLYKQKRQIKLAKIIHLLSEAEEGYISEEIKNLI